MVGVCSEDLERENHPIITITPRPMSHLRVNQIYLLTRVSQNGCSMLVHTSFILRERSSTNCDRYCSGWKYRPIFTSLQGTVETLSRTCQGTVKPNGDINNIYQLSPFPIFIAFPHTACSWNNMCIIIAFGTPLSIFFFE